MYILETHSSPFFTHAEEGLIVYLAWQTDVYILFNSILLHNKNLIYSMIGIDLRTDESIIFSQVAQDYCLILFTLRMIIPCGGSGVCSMVN